MDEEKELVSVIIPIYNTYEYLDECIESVVNQTYHNLEILLIDDGSTDQSGIKCEEWGKKDGRVVVYHKKNEGQGITRNFGIKCAKGEWVAFLDSDDWYDLEFVTKMHAEAIKENADVVTCDICRVDYETRNKSFLRCSSVIGVKMEPLRKIENDILGVVSKLSRRRLWIENRLEAPNSYAEDFAVVMPLLVAANKIAILDEMLYYYRKGRPNSTTTVKAVSRQNGVVKSAECILNNLKQNGRYEQYMIVAQKHILKNFSLILSGVWKSGTEEQVQDLKGEFQQFMKKHFDDYNTSKILHLGSFNLMRIIRELPLLQDASLSFQFSGIISIVNKTTTDMEIKHPNSFRKKMIERDIESAFWDVLESEKPDYFILDFLEERHDILLYRKGYITQSDAWKETSIMINNKIVQFGSAKWLELWKESCMLFIKRIEKYFTGSQIVLVKNYLTEEYGDINCKTTYDNIDEIRMTNAVLSQCYDFFEMNCSQVQVIEASNETNYFTDVMYEYGHYPWHLNDIVNSSIAKVLQQKIFG